MTDLLPLSCCVLQAVMGASDEVGILRWTRCIVELVRAASHMCPTSMGVAYLEMLHKLSRCALLLLLPRLSTFQLVGCWFERSSRSLDSHGVA